MVLEKLDRAEGVRKTENPARLFLVWFPSDWRRVREQHRPQSYPSYQRLPWGPRHSPAQSMHTPGSHRLRPVGVELGCGTDCWESGWNRPREHLICVLEAACTRPRRLRTFWVLSRPVSCLHVLPTCAYVGKDWQWLDLHLLEGHNPLKDTHYRRGLSWDVL